VDTFQILNPTEEGIVFQWYWGVPKYSFWLSVKKAEILAGYDNKIDLSFTIPNWGSTPFGNVFYVQLLANGKVLDADVACWAYSPGKAIQADVC
jgi:hypothetical protein